MVNLFTELGCFSPSVCTLVQKLWVQHGGRLTYTNADFYMADFFFCDGKEDPWFAELSKRGLIVRHAAWVSICVSERFRMPIGAYTLDAHFDQNSTRFIFIKPSLLLVDANLKPERNHGEGVQEGDDGDGGDTIDKGPLIGVDATDTTISTSISNNSSTTTVIGSDPHYHHHRQHHHPAAKQLNPRYHGGQERNTRPNQEIGKEVASLVIEGVVSDVGSAAPASRRLCDSTACAEVQSCQRVASACVGVVGRRCRSDAIDNATWTYQCVDHHPCGKHGCGRQALFPAGETVAARSRSGLVTRTAKCLAPGHTTAETASSEPPRKRMKRTAVFPEPDVEKVKRLVKFFEEHCIATQLKSSKVTTATSEASPSGSGNTETQTRPQQRQVLTAHTLFWNDLWAKGLIDVTDLPTSISRRVDSSDLPTRTQTWTAEMEMDGHLPPVVVDKLELRVDSHHGRSRSSEAICTRDTLRLANLGGSLQSSESCWKIKVQDLVHAPRTRAGIFVLGERYGGREFGRVIKEEESAE